MIDLSQWTGAIFSTDRVFRYVLWRRFKAGNRFMNCLMLNPSTATDVKFDPTVKRCAGRAATLGYDGLIVTNLYAFRSPYPQILVDRGYPVGDSNNVYIAAAAELSEIILCGWGNRAEKDRAADVIKMLMCLEHGSKFRCLSTNKDGSPAHPLYLPYSQNLKQWNPNGGG